MKSEGLIARAETKIHVPVARVWEAFINPKIIKTYMFGTDVISEWKKDSPIVWKGEWKGKPYEDKGKIINIDPNKRLQYTHFSPLSGKADILENYHTVTIEMNSDQEETRISLSQDKNESEGELKESQRNWQMMLDSLKSILEKDRLEELN
ncbi:MAG TPA: SRPBCC family protein [Puia sp.]|nr:SRPBCC family protein [Puia sp.]